MRRESYRRIAEECGTPAYVFDTDVLRDKIAFLKDNLGGKVRICYAMKANAFLIEPLKGLADCFEVCSPGEYAICEKSNIPQEDIVLSGVFKERKDVLAAIRRDNGKGVYTIESLQQLRIIEECASEINVKVDTLIRVTSGNQFGMDESQVKGVVSDRNQYPHIHFRGIQFYSGTQKKKAGKIKKELEELDRLYTELRDECNYEIEELEYGPGLPASYFINDEIDDLELLNQLRLSLEKMNYQGKITLEMGRYIAFDCGYYFAKIVDMKTNRQENYCIIDGGIHHINYYGQTFAMKTPYVVHLGNVEDGTSDSWKICGSLCTVGDVVLNNFSLNSPQEGDILVFENIGAYSVTEGIYLFLSRNLPKIYFYSEKNGLELRREETPTYKLNF